MKNKLGYEAQVFNLSQLLSVAKLVTQWSIVSVGSEICLRGTRDGSQILSSPIVGLNACEGMLFVQTQSGSIYQLGMRAKGP